MYICRTCSSKVRKDVSNGLQGEAKTGSNILAKARMVSSLLSSLETLAMIMSVHLYELSHLTENIIIDTIYVYISNNRGDTQREMFKNSQL